MNEKQIKRHFEDRGMKIADVAREMNADFPDITPGSADMMLRQLIAGHRWYPVYADWLLTMYGVKVNKPSWLKPVRERMRRAAA
jgi:hypothetical protein